MRLGMTGNWAKLTPVASGSATQIVLTKTQTKEISHEISGSWCRPMPTHWEQSSLKS